MKAKRPARRAKVKPFPVPPETESGPAAPPSASDPFPLELVVATAAKLLRPTGKESDYREAARQALDLIEGCRREMNARRRQKEWEQEEYRREMGWKEPRWEFAAGVRYITGETDLSRARALFRQSLPDLKLIHEVWRYTVEDSERKRITAEDVKSFEIYNSSQTESPEAIEEADIEFAECERDGFSPTWAAVLREMFTGWRDKKRSASASERGRKGAAARRAKAESQKS